MLQFNCWRKKNFYFLLYCWVFWGMVSPTVRLKRLLFSNIVLDRFLMWIGGGGLRSHDFKPSLWTLCCWLFGRVLVIDWNALSFVIWYFRASVNATSSGIKTTFGNRRQERNHSGDADKDKTERKERFVRLIDTTRTKGSVLDDLQQTEWKLYLKCTFFFICCDLYGFASAFSGTIRHPKHGFNRKHRIVVAVHICDRYFFSVFAS